MNPNARNTQRELLFTLHARPLSVPHSPVLHHMHPGERMQAWHPRARS